MALVTLPHVSSYLMLFIIVFTNVLYPISVKIGFTFIFNMQKLYLVYMVPNFGLMFVSFIPEFVTCQTLPVK